MTKSGVLIAACDFRGVAFELADEHVAARRMIVHRQRRRYESVTVYGSEEQVAPLAAPEVFLTVAGAFVE